MSFRNNEDKEFKYWFNFAVKLGEEISTVSSVPRLATDLSWFRPNRENDDPLSYYKRSLAITFLDYINF